VKLSSSDGRPHPLARDQKTNTDLGTDSWPPAPIDSRAPSPKALGKWDAVIAALDSNSKTARFVIICLAFGISFGVLGVLIWQIVSHLI